MENLPKPKVYFYVFSLLIIYFSIDFYKNSKKQFVQLNFNWKEEKLIHRYDNVIIDSVAYNYVSIKFPKSNQISPNNTFAFQTNNDKYYFRTSTIQKENSLSKFKHLIWLKNKAPSQNDKGFLLELDIPLIQNGDKTTNTIGDTFLTYKWANYFRKFLSEKLNTVFVGNQKDLFAYPYDAYFLKSTSFIADKISETEYAQIYILFMGDHDLTLSDKQIISNWKIILTELENREKTEKIILLLLPPSRKEKKNNYRIRYNKLLKSLKTEYDIQIIDVYNLLNKETDLDVTGDYPNKNGYKKIANKINEIY